MSEIPRILFHGTNKAYHDLALYTFSKYANLDGSSIQMTNSQWDAAEWAQLKKHKDSTNSNLIILVIDTQKVTCQIRPKPINPNSHYLCEYLNEDSYEIFESDVEQGFRKENMGEIEQIIHQLLNSEPAQSN